MDAYVTLAGERRATSQHSLVTAPWDGALLGRAGLAEDALCEEAVALAHARFEATAALPAYVRRDHLLAVARGLEARRDEVAALVAREAAKPIRLASLEVSRAVGTFALSAEEATRVNGELLALDHGPAAVGMTGLCARVPAGPVLAITPFNFPLNLVAHKLGPAFAIGATVVLKPAPQTPLTALALADVVREAADATAAQHGVDAATLRALLSVVPCDVASAERMARDARFAVLSFTGSAAVGWHLKGVAGRKRVLLELGGNAAAVLCPDADVGAALDKLVPAAYGHAGQVCIKAQRVFAPRHRLDEVARALVARTEAVPVLDPMAPSALCSSLIDVRAAERVARWVGEAVAGGARVLTGGAREGNRVTPAVLEGVTPGMALHDEEVFGPVVTVHPYDHLDDAWRGVNASRYGLQTAVFTRDLGAVTAAFRALRVGAVVVNEATNVRVDAMPYGGVKDSGFGREGVRYAIEEMTERKMLLLRGLL